MRPTTIKQSFTSLSVLALALLTGAAQAADSKGPCGVPGLERCPQPFDKVLPAPKDMLTWDQATRVVGFRNTYRMYHGDVFSNHGAKPYPLTEASKKLNDVSYRIDGKSYKLADYLKNQSVTGLLVLKDGKIAYEYYGQGNTQQTLWTSRSVAKSVVSVLVGVAVKEGKIKSLDDKISAYVPELKGTEWQDVTLQQLMQHTSGVQWDENYAAKDSDFSHMTQCEARPNPYDCVLQLVRSVKRKPGVKPGEVWSYNTGGAWLVGRVLENATGMTIAKYLESRIWSRYPMQQDGVWHALVPGKVDMGGHGFNATLRDWGRFGQFVLSGGQLPGGEKLLPDDWISRSTHWTTAKGSVTAAAPNGQYGYQWWYNAPAPDADSEPKQTANSDKTFWALGIFGQTIAINQAEGLVVVQWSTWKHAETPSSLYDEQAVFVNAVSQALER
ncbi:beta-lactamase family protein [Pseudomonas xanthosomatis]|uniref:serine hydrolase domain-containing protein n=1 Tax=Pseudomonas xanthosomatis TaxID=2842356 RepID=UPI001C3CA3C8|nr:serine hydrolase [Pseudomonas xanthosomatis]QXH44526.1 beta-lactamase family protein [Pseudomonas xanthosomatis]